MPHWTRSLAVRLVLPYLVTVPPLLAVGYLLASRAIDTAAVDLAGSVALQEAQAIGARLPAALPPEALAQRCREEVRGTVARLTVIAASGVVLCDSEAAPAEMVNHLQRPEVAGALRQGSGIDRRESATVHYPLLYAAVRLGEGADARVVRVGMPTELLGAALRRLETVVRLMVLFTGIVGLAPALYLARRLGRRLGRMTSFARAVAAGDLSQRLGAVQRDELGALEEHLDGMAVRLERWFDDMQKEGEKVRGVLGGMLEGVAVIARTGEVMLMNRRAEQLFGIASGIGTRGRHLVEMCRDPELQGLLRDAIAGTVPMPSREILLAGDARRYLSVSVAPIGGRQQDAPGLVLVLHDITELKRLETMRRDFVANVSHELRTPLTAIRGYAETLLAGALDDPARARQFLAVIDRHADRLGRLIDDLLTLSDLELGKTALKREAVQVEALADEVIEVLREKAERGNVALRKEIPVDMPLLMGDADRLQQVLINLTDNAVKYTPAGGRVTISARVTREREKPMVEVAVADTGIGIPAEVLPRLTERFYRVDKARSRELGGTGLGLAIVKHLVQAHGGHLDIASTVNVGTTVRFAIPAWAPIGEQ